MPQTILLTGITGFIAKRIALDLLDAGYNVRGSLRSKHRAREVRSALTANGAAPEALSRLSFVELDLMKDDGWQDAMDGVDAVLHTASPFPIGETDDAKVVTPAVEGTLRALRAAQAKGVTRIVLTSSMEAVMHGVTSDPITETDWSNPDAPSCSAYTRSKIFAEKAAWDFVTTHPEMQLTTINPAMVCGIPMDRDYGSSVRVVERLVTGKDPMLPRVPLPIVDVEDVSAMHVRALSTPVTIGQRYIAADSFMQMNQAGAILARAFPGRGIATRTAPNLMVKALALFDKDLRTVTNWLGWDPSLSHAKAAKDMDIAFVPAAEAVTRTARFLVDAPSAA
ncbi:NAD-dependent epimerase/dehydratase family protein [Aliiroseovarius sp. PTFE2010]|uniref:NAD-dependent epimerase/dehydratase family protein n=1 Tax=Aliiroseovarius sp. PTFE2010 TaxID=3417190 RepID=UPI003CF8BA00